MLFVCAYVCACLCASVWCGVVCCVTVIRYVIVLYACVRDWCVCVGVCALTHDGVSDGVMCVCA